MSSALLRFHQSRPLGESEQFTFNFLRRGFQQLAPADQDNVGARLEPDAVATICLPHFSPGPVAINGPAEGPSTCDDAQPQSTLLDLGQSENHEVANLWSAFFKGLSERLRFDESLMARKGLLPARI